MGRTSLIFFHCITPLHNGAGQGLGAIDRPVIRESVTGYPFIQGSSIKGVLLAEVSLARGVDDSVVKATFGTGGTSGYQGCATVTDAALLLLPVRSLAGTFVWATSRLALARLARFLDVAEDHGPLRDAVAKVLKASSGLPKGSALGAERWPAAGDGEDPPKGPWDAAIRLDGKGPYCIEQLVLEAQGGGARGNVAELAVRLGEILFPEDGSEARFWKGFFKRRLLVLHDDDFRDLAQRATHVEANIKIEANGVTKDGSLRYTEYLPAETVLVSLLEQGRSNNGASPGAVAALVDGVLSRPLQIGADESTGKGLVRVVHHKLEAAGQEAGHGES